MRAAGRVEYVADERGVPITQWDGRTTKAHPVTGEQVPDETARVPVERYVNPGQAQWPEADFVVGNPPFIGNKRMRLALGDGYVEALRNTWHTSRCRWSSRFRIIRGSIRRMERRYELR